jgi:hypothetical protein
MSSLLSRFKKKTPKPVFNLHHEDIKHQVEVAFEVKGKKYYRFKKELQLPAGRYKYVYSMLRETDLRMNLETLKNFVTEFKNVLNGGPKKIIAIGDLWKLINNLESRISLAFEPETVERLASVVYFDDTEDLSTWDRKHGLEKVAFWKANKSMDFFLTSPMGELLGVSDISIESLEEYIQTTTGIIQDLTFAPSSQSTENLSENGKAHS